MSDSNDLEQIISDQMATIDDLRAELAARESDIEWLEDGEKGDPYWPNVYDRIRAAWGRWALAELGTASPSPLDLTGRPELDALWQSIK